MGGQAGILTLESKWMLNTEILSAKSWKQGCVVAVHVLYRPGKLQAAWLRMEVNS